MNNTSWKSLAPFATLAGLIIVVWLDVRTEVRDVRSELTAEIASIRTELTAEIASTRTELTAEIASIRAEITAVDRRLSEQIAAMDRRISNVTERVAHIEGLLEGAQTKKGD